MHMLREPCAEVLMDKGVINTIPHGLIVLATLITMLFCICVCVFV